MSVLELFEVPEGTRLADGALVRPFDRLPLRGPLRLGAGEGAVRVPGLRPEAWCEVAADRRLRCGAEVQVAKTGGVSRLELTSDRRTPDGRFALRVIVAFRVVDDAAPSVAWPDTPKSRLLAAAVPGVETLTVLADALTEEGEPLGPRLSGLAATEADDAHWLAHLGPLVDGGVADVTWSRGVVEALTLRGEAVEALRTLSAHALTHLVQRLDFVPFPVAGFDAAWALGGLASGALPWLTTVRVHHAEAWGFNGAVRLAARPDGALRAAAPRLTELGARASPELVVASEGRREPLGYRPVVLGRPPGGAKGTTTLRSVFGVPLLQSRDGELTLNGRLRHRAEPANWRLALKEGDVIELDGIAYAVEPA